MFNIFFSYLFYTDTGDVPYIGRSSMDGSFKVAIVATKIRQVNGLAIDYTCKSTKSLYIMIGVFSQHVVEYKRLYCATGSI